MIQPCLIHLQAISLVALQVICRCGPTREQLRQLVLLADHRVCRRSQRLQSGRVRGRAERREGAPSDCLSLNFHTGSGRAVKGQLPARQRLWCPDVSLPFLDLSLPFHCPLYTSGGGLPWRSMRSLRRSGRRDTLWPIHRPGCGPRGGRRRRRVGRWVCGGGGCVGMGMGGQALSAGVRESAWGGAKGGLAWQARHLP